MKRNRMVSLLLAGTILFSLCCSGCSKDTPETKPIDSTAVKNEPVLTEAPTTVPAETVPETTESGVPVRWQNGGKMSFLPQEPLTIPNLSEMPYSRPAVC